jgi:hypothetical protein
MLYKVTPLMESEPEKKPRDPAATRKRRATAIYDRDGNEVLISLMCLKCRKVKPLAQFGLRRMADGAIRNQPWCRTCRSGAGTHKPKTTGEVETAVETVGPAGAIVEESMVEIEQQPMLAAAETGMVVESTPVAFVSTEPESAAPAVAAPELPQA